MTPARMLIGVGETIAHPMGTLETLQWAATHPLQGAQAIVDSCINSGAMELGNCVGNILIGISAVESAIGEADTLLATSTETATTTAEELATSGAFAADELVESGNYVVRTPAGDYVGQFGRISERLARHVADGKFTQAEVDVALRYAVEGGKLERESAEQLLIDSNGGIANLLNKINPIGPARFDNMPVQPYTR